MLLFGSKQSNPRVLGSPIQARPHEIMKNDHIVLYYIIGKYNSDKDELDRQARPLSTITLVVHPRGENHGLAIT